MEPQTLIHGLIVIENKIAELGITLHEVRPITTMAKPTKTNASHPVSLLRIIGCAHVDFFTCQKSKTFANYVSCVRTGNVIYTAGHLPMRTDGSLMQGTLGKDLEVEDGYKAARACAMGLITTIKGTREGNVFSASTYLFLGSNPTFSFTMLFFASPPPENKRNARRCSMHGAWYSAPTALYSHSCPTNGHQSRSGSCAKSSES